MPRDWAAVADAMKSRLADLDMTQADLVQRSPRAPMTIRELLYNSAQRRRSDQTLAALSRPPAGRPVTSRPSPKAPPPTTPMPVIRRWPNWPR